MNEPITLRPSLHELASRHLSLVDGEIAIVEGRSYVPKSEYDSRGGTFYDYGEASPSHRVLAMFPRTEGGRRAALAALADMERDVLHRRAEIDATQEEAAHKAEAERRERIERAKDEKLCVTCCWCMHITGDEQHLLCGRFYKCGRGITTTPKEKEVGPRSFDAALHPRVTADHGCDHHELDVREI